MRIYRAPYKSLAVMPARRFPPRGQQSLASPKKPFRGMNRFMVFIIAMAIIPWFVGGYQIFGFNITGWTWVIPLVLSSLICLGNVGRITFPFLVWIPWVGLLSLYWLLGRYNPNATQSLLQTLSPVIVGCAASVFRPDRDQLDAAIYWITRLGRIVWIILIIRVPVILTGVLPEYGLMTAEMIGVLLLGSCYAAFYACGSLRHIYYYLAMLAMMLASLTRGPIVAMLSCLPLTPAPLKMRKRIALCLCLAFCAIVLFNTDRIQQRMFYSGSGELSDLYWGNPDLATSGRSVMWDILWRGVKDAPLLGHGLNSHRVLLILSGMLTYAPHNDWLKITYDMGFVGSGLYFFIMLWQMAGLVKIARDSDGAHRMLAYGAASAFVPYILIMLTDNVLLYVQFFGNLHFALIGIVYGAMRQNKESGY